MKVEFFKPSKLTIAAVFAVLFAGLVLCNSAVAQTQTPLVVVPISLTTMGVAYTQNFDTNEAPPSGPGLTDGTNNTLSAVVPPGWGFVETGSGADAFYRVASGSVTNADTYSYGTATGGTAVPPTNVERAFGARDSSTVVSQIGVQFTNNTGSTITSITISYTGEQWREGTATTDKLDFRYNQNSTVGNLTAGTFSDFNSLDYTAGLNGTDATLDGNANKTLFTSVSIPVNVAPGQTITLRWDGSDNLTGTDAGLAIDDFTLTPVPEPSTWVGAALAVGFIGWTQRKRILRSARQTA